MCDPVSLVVGAVAGTVASKVLAPKMPSAAAMPDPAEERAAAEAEAQQRANAQLAADQRRRREQGSLLARGAPTAPTVKFGESSTSADGTGTSPLSGMTTRRTTTRQASLLGRGGSISLGGGGSSRGGLMQDLA